MFFEEKEIPLKDGRTAVFRSPHTSDAEEVLRFLRSSFGETPYLLRTPEECTETIEQEARFLQTVLESENDVMILCIVDGKIAGNCQIKRAFRQKMRHRGRVAIALLKEYWSLGIGTAMFQEMISIARRWDLMQLELEFIEGNDRAKGLYEKMGFCIIGEMPNAIRLADGTLLREFQMIRML